jgi:hypothetical protein
MYTISDGKVRETKSVSSGSWEGFPANFNRGEGNATQLTSVLSEHSVLYTKDSTAPFENWYMGYPSLTVGSIDQYLRDETVSISGQVLDYVPAVSSVNVTVTFPNGTVFHTVTKAVDQEFHIFEDMFNLTSSFPYGFYDVQATYNGKIATTTFEVISILLEAAATIDVLDEPTYNCGAKNWAILLGHNGGGYFGAQFGRSNSCTNLIGVPFIDSPTAPYHTKKYFKAGSKNLNTVQESYVSAWQGTRPWGHDDDDNGAALHNNIEEQDLSAALKWGTAGRYMWFRDSTYSSPLSADRENDAAAGIVGSNVWFCDTRSDLGSGRYGSCLVIDFLFAKVAPSTSGQWQEILFAESPDGPSRGGGDVDPWWGLNDGDGDGDLDGCTYHFSLIMDADANFPGQWYSTRKNVAPAVWKAFHAKYENVETGVISLCPYGQPLDIYSYKVVDAEAGVGIWSGDYEVVSMMDAWSNFRWYYVQ